jgi:hypothetical protein
MTYIVLVQRKYTPLHTKIINDGLGVAVVKWIYMYVLIKHILTVTQSF